MRTTALKASSYSLGVRSSELDSEVDRSKKTEKERMGELVKTPITTHTHGFNLLGETERKTRKHAIQITVTCRWDVCMPVLTCLSRRATSLGGILCTQEGREFYCWRKSSRKTSTILSGGSQQHSLEVGRPRKCGWGTAHQSQNPGAQIVSLLDVARNQLLSIMYLY